ncbi:uncharacterized protein [Ptychodera flava]|uniref:uncharacterized protein n=1 Tax=Ptychodera flava TaxID=63121 RepID=UPI00396A364A
MLSRDTCRILHTSCQFYRSSIVILVKMSGQPSSFPRRESDLWTALNSERKSDDFTFEKRLGIANDVAHGCRFLTSQGIPATDLRVTNVILKRENDIFRAEINIIKPTDYDVPYPDRKPPFHIAPELYSQKDSDAADTKANRSDIYAFGILLWWLLHGEYSRPSYAQTTEMIKTAVTKQNKNPLSDEEKKVTKRLKVYRKRLTDCWSACRPSWNDIVSWFDPSGGSGSATTHLSDMGPVTESDDQGAGRAEMKAAISAAGKPRGERPDTESSGPESDDLPADPSSIVLDIESDTPAIKSGSKNQGTATDETYTGTYTEGRGSPERDSSTHKKESGTIEMSIDAQQKGSGKPEDGAQTKGRVIPEEDCSTPDMSVGMQKKRKKGGGHPHVDTGTKLNEWSTSEMGSGTKKKESVASEKKSGAKKKGKSGANKEGGNKNKNGDAVEVESAARVTGTGDTRATRSGTHGSVEGSSPKTHITEKQAKKLQRGTAAKERGVDDATETTVHAKKKPMMETAV